MFNPFKVKLERAKLRLSRLEAQQKRQDANDMPGPFITGNSGIPASRRRRLDRQLERTIDAAVAIVEARQNMNILQAKHDAYERGEINAQGRTIRPKIKEPQNLPVFEKMEDRIFIADMGGGLTWTDMRVRRQDDFKAIVTLDRVSLEPFWYKGGFPEELLEIVRRQVENERQRILAKRAGAPAASASGDIVPPQQMGQP